VGKEKIDTMRGVAKVSVLAPYLFNVYLEADIQSGQTIRN
jgi:hypothetical protein